MSGQPELLTKIKGLIEAKKYRVRIHAVRHMVEEGFGEDDLIEALVVRSRVLEDYPDELRCLLLGYFRTSEVVDIVTAYIPQKPWWPPTKRGRML